MAVFMANAKKIKEAADKKKEEEMRATIKQTQKQIYQKLGDFLVKHFKDKKPNPKEDSQQEKEKPTKEDSIDTFGQNQQQPPLSSRSSQKTPQQKRDDKFAALIS